MSGLAIFPMLYATNAPIAGGVRGLAWPVMKTSEFNSTAMMTQNKYQVAIINTFNPFWRWTLIFNYLKDDPNDVPALYAPYTDYKTIQGFYLSQHAQAGTFLFLDYYDNYVGPAMISSTSTSAGWRANWTPITSAIIVVTGNAWQATSVTGPSGWTQPSGFSGAGPVTDGGVTWTKIGSAGATIPNPDAQLQLVTDGTYWYSPLQRNFGGRFLEDITDLNANTSIGGSALAVYADGVLQTLTTNYTLNGPGLSINGYSYQGMYLKWVTSSPPPPPTAPITSQFNFFFRACFETDDLDFEQFLNEVWTVGGPDTKNGAGYLKIQTRRPEPL